MERARFTHAGPTSKMEISLLFCVKVKVKSSSSVSLHVAPNPTTLVYAALPHTGNGLDGAPGRQSNHFVCQQLLHFVRGRPNAHMHKCKSSRNLILLKISLICIALAPSNAQNEVHYVHLHQIMSVSQLENHLKIKTAK